MNAIIRIVISFLWCIVVVDAHELSNLTLETTLLTRDLQQEFTQQLCPSLMTYDLRCKRNLFKLKKKYNFKNNTFNNELGIKKIDAYRMEYPTLGIKGETRMASAAVLVPQLKADKIKGIVLFYHGTIINKSSVPSNYAGDPGKVGQDLAAVYASHGYVVIAPDYIGMGKDKNNMHPYVMFPQTNAADGIAALKSARNMLDQNGLLYLNQDVGLYITGYSEGGAYALWASKLLQNSTNKLKQMKLKLVRTVGMSGVYDLSHAEIDFLSSDVNDGCWQKSKRNDGSYVFNWRCITTHMQSEVVNQSALMNQFHITTSIISAKAKPSLITFALASYAYYYDNKNYAKYFLPEYYALKCDKCTIGGKHYNMDEIFVHDNSNLNNDDINMMFYQASIDLKQPFNADEYDPDVIISTRYDAKKFNTHENIGLKNSVFAFVAHDVLNHYKLQQVLQQADIYQWHTTSPITLIYLANDSIVTPLNSINAQNGITPHDLITGIPVRASFSSVWSDFLMGAFKIPGINYPVAIGIDHEVALEILLAISLESLHE